MKPSSSRTAGDAERILAAIKATRDVSAGVRYDLEISDGTSRAPSILLLPHAHAPVPAALLLHGFGSRKERMADTIGEALLRHGIVALSLDLPLHGARSESPGDLKGGDSVRLLGTWRDAIGEARLALDYLRSHDAVDGQRLAIVGYSLGSFLANIVAAGSPEVRAMVLAASGDLPEGLPFESLVRAVVDPLRAVRSVKGRPLLMVNGRFDRSVKPSQAERLFAAAHEPKMMRWYGGGHWPPAREIEYAAEWLACQLESEHRTKRRMSS
jgi:dienelactone hydrolase